RGQFLEANERIEQASKVGVSRVASVERRSQATLSLWKSINEVDLGLLDEAWADLQQATTELSSHPQFGPLCESTPVWVLAVAGEREEAVRRAAALLRVPNTSTLRPSIEWACLALLGRGLLEAGEIELARYCWELFLSSTPPPIAAPMGHYYLG